jgi:hypothetical protein
MKGLVGLCFSRKGKKRVVIDVWARLVRCVDVYKDFMTRRASSRRCVTGKALCYLVQVVYDMGQRWCLRRVGSCGL